MNRTTRTELARQTLGILERGSYDLPDGRVVNITSAVGGCLEATRFLPPEELERLRQQVLARPVGGNVAAVEVVNETTLAGVARVLSDGGGPVAALNF